MSTYNDFLMDLYEPRRARTATIAAHFRSARARVWCLAAQARRAPRAARRARRARAQRRNGGRRRRRSRAPAPDPGRPHSLAAAIAVGLVLLAGASPAGAAPRYELGGLPPARRPAIAHTADAAPAPPASSSLARWAPAPFDQGSVADCAAAATAYTGMSILENEDHAAGALDNPLGQLPAGGPAPEYVYSQTRQPGGGSFIDADTAVEEAQGDDNALDYAQGPFDYVDLPTAGEIANAANWRLAASADIGTDQSSIETAISTGHPVVIGIEVTAAFEANYTGIYPDPGITADDSAALGAHAVTAIGYTPEGLLIENSWGAYWGAGGFATLAWSWVEGAYQTSGEPDAWQAVQMGPMIHVVTPAPQPPAPQPPVPQPPKPPTPALYRVPKLRGDTIPRAREQLGRDSLRLGRVHGPARGQILRQSPTPGSREPSGHKVAVWTRSR